MGSCDLCGLPTPTPPIEADGEGTFCCRGCERVARTLGELPDATHELQTSADMEAPEDAAIAYFRVDGMHCTTCEAFLTHRADRLDGVYALEVNYAMEAAKAFYDSDEWDPETLSSACSGHGYTFQPRTGESEVDPRQRRRSDTAQRLVIGGFLAMLIMPWYFFYLYPIYLGFESGILDLGRTTAVGIYFPLIVIGVMSTIVLAYTGYPLLRGAWISVRTRQPNMDLLVSIAALSAFVYSVIALAGGSTHLYFDVTVMVVLVVSLGRYYEEGLRASALSTLADITDARVKDARRLARDGHETVPIERLSPGDEVVVHPGERIPVDGTMVRGPADIDESILTGEGLPVTRRPGEEVSGGTKVIDETIVLAVGPDAESTIDRIAAAMWDIQSERSGIQRFADTLATVFVPVVLALGIAVTVWRLWHGEPLGSAILWGLTILLVSCPCAMGLATPLAMSAGLRDALASGIVVTNQSVFELVPDAEHLIFDKTGTLTTGEMTVSAVFGDDRTLQLAGAVERISNHPIADAIVAAAASETPPRADGGLTSELTNTKHDTRNLTPPQDVERFPGAGIAATVADRRVVVGTPDLISTRVGDLPTSLEEQIERIDEDGGMPIVVGWGGLPRGVIAVEDRERPAWRGVIDQFSEQRVTVLTGDESGAVDRFRDHPGIDEVFAGIPPDAKAETVGRLSAEETTIMVGDGTNDAPALAAADLGIALGDGTADACDAADVILVEDDLEAVDRVFSTARGTRRRIRENILWAFMYNAIALPLAVVGLINPFFAAVAMGASSVIVVVNSRRAV